MPVFVNVCCSSIAALYRTGSAWQLLCNTLAESYGVCALLFSLLSRALPVQEGTGKGSGGHSL